MKEPIWFEKSTDKGKIKYCCTFGGQVARYRDSVYNYDVEVEQELDPREAFFLFQDNIKSTEGRRTSRDNSDGLRGFEHGLASSAYLQKRGPKQWFYQVTFPYCD